MRFERFDVFVVGKEGRAVWLGSGHDHAEAWTHAQGHALQTGESFGLFDQLTQEIRPFSMSESASV